MQIVEKSLISSIGAVYIFVLKTRYGCNLSVDGISTIQDLVTIAFAPGLPVLHCLREVMHVDF